MRWNELACIEWRVFPHGTMAAWMEIMRGFCIDAGGGRAGIGGEYKSAQVMHTVYSTSRKRELPSHITFSRVYVPVVCGSDVLSSRTVPFSLRQSTEAQMTQLFLARGVHKSRERCDSCSSHCAGCYIYQKMDQ